MKNPEMTLFEWRDFINNLLYEEYGEYPGDTILYVDAGRSDCQLVIKEKDNK